MRCTVIHHLSNLSAATHFAPVANGWLFLDEEIQRHDERLKRWSDAVQFIGSASSAWPHPSAIPADYSSALAPTRDETQQKKLKERWEEGTEGGEGGGRKLAIDQRPAGPAWRHQWSVTSLKPAALIGRSDRNQSMTRSRVEWNFSKTVSSGRHISLIFSKSETMRCRGNRAWNPPLRVPHIEAFNYSIFIDANLRELQWKWIKLSVDRKDGGAAHCGPNNAQWIIGRIIRNGANFQKLLTTWWTRRSAVLYDADKKPPLKRLVATR